MTDLTPDSAPERYGTPLAADANELIEAPVSASVSPAEPPEEAGIGTLTEHVDAALDIAQRLGNGTDNWTDAPTLMAHLRTIREDFCDG